MMTEDDMIQPDPELGKLVIAAARKRMDQQVRGIPAPEFKFPEPSTPWEYVATLDRGEFGRIDTRD